MHDHDLKAHVDIPMTTGTVPHSPRHFPANKSQQMLIATHGPRVEVDKYKRVRTVTGSGIK